MKRRGRTPDRPAASGRGIKDRFPVSRLREIMGPDAPESDAQLEAIRDWLGELAEFVIDQAIEEARRSAPPPEPEPPPPGPELFLQRRHDGMPPDVYHSAEIWYLVGNSLEPGRGAGPLDEETRRAIRRAIEDVSGGARAEHRAGGWSFRFIRAPT